MGAPTPQKVFLEPPFCNSVSVIKMSYYNTIISKIYSRNTDNDRRRLCTIKYSRQTCESRKSTNQSNMSFKMPQKSEVLSVTDSRCLDNSLAITIKIINAIKSQHWAKYWIEIKILNNNNYCAIDCIDTIALNHKATQLVTHFKIVWKCSILMKTRNLKIL